MPLIIGFRIKKSLEQKEEFLRRPAAPPPHQQQQQQQQPQPAAKEFYSRAQKLLPPVWPPPSQCAEQPCSPPQDPTGPPVAAVAKQKFVNSLGKIHEDGVGKSAARAPESERSKLSNNNNNSAMQVVSMRAKQFESGRMDDKTDFYKSELARLTSKHNVPNVAVRKMEYEQKLHSDKKQPTVPQQQEIRDDSINSCSSNYNFFFLNSIKIINICCSLWEIAIGYYKKKKFFKNILAPAL